jgi:xanthine dehydrogenase molybdopterin-binding subunit B
MMDINYFLDDAQNSRQGQFELDFADVITCFDFFETTLVTECGRTLIISWTDAGFFKSYDVIYETPLMKGHPGMVEEIVAMLKHIQVDGETMQYILKRVGMQDQMLRQLVMSQPIGEVEYMFEERKQLEEFNKK